MTGNCTTPLKRVKPMPLRCGGPIGRLVNASAASAKADVKRIRRHITNLELILAARNDPDEYFEFAYYLAVSRQCLKIAELEAQDLNLDECRAIIQSACQDSKGLQS